VVPFQNCVWQSPRHPRWLLLLKIENSAKNHLKIIFSETAGPIGPKLWWNGLQMVFFENCVWRPRPPTKIAAVNKNRKFGKKSLKKLSPLKLLGQLGPNYGGMVFRWSSFRIVSDDPDCQPRWPPLLKIENSAKNHLKIISSETAGPIGPKLWWNGL
jgi:hypothetical protein